ncbi:MAG TPA: alkaline phosphatase family protein [Candidatus Acidoferrum sp.]|nr:alkaline phosphatase family protein [Candidatus Acidoferrum sp.]
MKNKFTATILWAAFRCAALVVTGALILSIALPTSAQDKKKPRLILQITVDQLRGDLPHRYYPEFGEGGFRYLYENGVAYEDAFQRHANTETIVGHTTLATGADPSTHGMVGNVWLDRETGKLVYNIQDARYPLLTKGAGVDQAAEIDPTQRLATSEGRSPAPILVSTFSDELALSDAGRSKIFGVSVKDRGAVPMAGHAGKAFWFSKKTGEFVTSTYYYKDYPSWAKDWNARKLASSYGGKSWELLHDRSAYQFGDRDDMPYETNFPGYGRIFPHPFGKSDSKYFTTLLTVSPVGDELTLSFAEALIDGEKLGQGANTDYLSISFSSTDYVGHLFGPSSLESEDNLLRLDRMLTELFKFVDQKVGLANTVIVLSADHGAAEIPGYLNEFGIDAKYFNPASLDPKTLEQQPAIEAVKKQFGIVNDVIQAYFPPYVYLNHDVLRERGLNRREVERAIAAELEKIDGVWLAEASDDLVEGSFPDRPLNQSILRNYNAKRSGDIYVVFEPGSFINDFDGLTVASTHGSPWRYDQFVPVIFVAPRISAQQVFREVSTVDVAPTLSAILGITYPSGSVGKPLVEVLQTAPRGATDAKK